MAEFERTFLIEPGRKTAQQLVHIAQERKWPQINIDKILPPGSSPFHDKLRLYVWEEATRLGIQTDFTPSPMEQMHLEHLNKTFGGPRPSDISEPT